MPGFVIPTINQGEADPNVMLKQLLNAYIMLTEELTYLLNNLDTKNMNEIDGDILVTGTVTAGKIAAGAITADKIDVDRLSAITANMGKLTSGEIYGAYIATRENAFPRAEMSNTENLFAAYLNSYNYIQMQANYGSVPSINIVNNGMVVGRLNALLGSLGIDSVGTLTITIQNGELDVKSASRLRTPKFSNVIASDGESLGVTLEQKARAGISTGMSGAANGGIPINTVFKDVNGVPHTWLGIPSHSHAQSS